MVHWPVKLSSSHQNDPPLPARNLTLMAAALKPSMFYLPFSPRMRSWHLNSQAPEPISTESRNQVNSFFAAQRKSHFFETPRKSECVFLFSMIKVSHSTPTHPDTENFLPAADVKANQLNTRRGSEKHNWDAPGRLPTSHPAPYRPGNLAGHLHVGDGGGRGMSPAPPAGF